LQCATGLRYVPEVPRSGNCTPAAEGTEVPENSVTTPTPQGLEVPNDLV